jgi:hypothetical protein
LLSTPKPFAIIFSEERELLFGPENNSLQGQMNREFNWLVFDDEALIAAFVSLDDAEQFIEQCGCATMRTAAAAQVPAHPIFKRGRRHQRKLKISDHPGARTSRKLDN